MVVYRDTGAGDAIAECSRRLVDAMREAGAPVSYVREGISGALSTHGDVAWFVLQYNPFSYARRGVAPALVRGVATLRRRTGAAFALCIHEPWTYVHDWRSLAMAAGQRAQLQLLLALADRVLVTTETHARRIGLGDSALHLPVGSNITPLELSRAEARSRLGIEEQLVLTTFGRSHPSRALDHVEAAIEEVARTRGRGGVTVFNLGRDAPALRSPAASVITPGPLRDDDLSLRLHATDVLLLPFRDGASTRRTTLMAGLAHGVATVAVDGPGTDRVFLDRDDALVLTPRGDRASYARAVAELCEDVQARRSVGAAGRRLYAQRFAWPVLARRLLDAVGHGGRRSTTQA